MNVIDKFEKCIRQAEKDGILRQLPADLSGVIDFSSNDYLGLSKNPEVIKAGCEAAQKYGAGSTGSRLLSGNRPLFEEFERTIARDKNTESALIFNSGFQANSGVLECLCDSHTVVFFDKLNHASMYQGVFASKAQLLRYQHLDYDHLEKLLKEHVGKPLLIVSETIFGMDGDIASLKILSNLADRYGALLYLDEAHATGLYGHDGYGLSTDCSFDHDKTIIMGTFSKALGSSGAYVACSSLVKNYLINKCRGFIYSTALSPFCIGAASKAWELVCELGDTRLKIMNNAEKLRHDLGIKGTTNIVTIIFEYIPDMLEMKAKCMKNGIIVSGIRRPTSPTPRIRIAINASHTTEDIKRILDVLLLSFSA